MNGSDDTGIRPDAGAAMTSLRSWDRGSRVFSGAVGEALPVARLPAADYVLDRNRFASEGDWLFTRFTHESILAVRMGFQAGSFNIGPDEQPDDPSRLQLQLEVMTRDGGDHWLPTGAYAADAVRSDPRTKDVRFEPGGPSRLTITGWPDVQWHGRSDDGSLEARLGVSLRSVTLLPDCRLPRAVFGMWESMGTARGWVRVGDQKSEVQGTAFYDHTRVVHERHAVPARQWYLYTTLAFGDGSGLFGYYAEHEGGVRMDDYCFGVYVDASGNGHFLDHAATSQVEWDEDGLPERWELDWRGEDAAVQASVAVVPVPMRRAWGGTSLPRTRADYLFIPLVLESSGRVTSRASSVRVGGRGLGEHWRATRAVPSGFRASRGRS
jgi:hypothetical protein